MAARTWLFKSEPEEFSVEDLRRSPQQTARWDGIRNYQARNLLRDRVRVGDRALFHHSGIREPAVAGTVEIVRAAYPDPTQFDPGSKFFDPKSSPEYPRWLAVDVRLREVFPRPLTLAELREVPALADMMLLKRGMRLSVQPVTGREWRAILRLAAR